MVWLIIIVVVAIIVVSLPLIRESLAMDPDSQEYKLVILGSRQRYD